MLQPLRASFRRHGAYLLRLPSAAVRPGALLDSRGALFQDLMELDAFWGGSRARAGASKPAHFLLDQTRVQTTVGASIGAGIPDLASLRALGAGQQKVVVEIKGISVCRVCLGSDEQQSSDWIDRLSVYDDLYELQAAMAGMKRRRAWWPTPREIDVVQATVHVEELTFTTYSNGGIEAEVEIERALPMDLDAGFNVEWNGQLSWRAGSIPIGYLPVRYAWAPRQHRFVAARI